MSLTLSASDPSGVEARIGVRDLLLLALGTGLAAGLVHAGVVTTRATWFGEFKFAPRDVAWMAPVGYAVILLAVAAPCMVLVGLVRRPAWGKASVFLLLFVGSFGMVLHATFIHPLALLALAGGLAARAAYPVWTRPAVWRGRLAQATLALFLLTVLLGLGETLFRHLRERRSMAGLPPAAPGAPSVLILVLDTVRAASMSLYGYTRQTTPNLDRFAEDGTVFEHAFAPSSWTLPSHAGMFTGRWPGQVSARWKVRLDGAEPTLAEALRSLGYATGGFVANLYYTSYDSGLARGFSRYEEPFRPSLQQAVWTTTLSQLGWVRQSLKNRPLARPASRPGAVAMGAERAGLPPEMGTAGDRGVPGVAGGVGGRPYLAFLNYFDAHDPYGPPAPWRDRFGAGHGDQQAYDASIAMIDGDRAGSLECSGSEASWTTRMWSLLPTTGSSSESTG